MISWLIVYLAAVGLNVVPAFMPPTWALLAFFHISRDLPVLPLAAVGALGAMTGRFILAMTARYFGMRVVPKQYTANIESLVDTIQQKRALSIASLGLFAIGPIPTNHLFIALGLSRAPLLIPLLVFGVTRGTSYVIWVTAADTAATSLQDFLNLKTGGIVGIIFQVGGFVLLYFLLKIDWGTRLRRVLNLSPTGEDPAATAPDVVAEAELVDGEIAQAPSSVAGAAARID